MLETSPTSNLQTLRFNGIVNFELTSTDQRLFFCSVILISGNPSLLKVFNNLKYTCYDNLVM